MSYAVHDSQPSQTWTGSKYTPNKRKPFVLNREDEEIESRSTRTISGQQKRKELSKGGYNKRKTSSNSSTQVESPNTSTNVDRFLIDGIAPTPPSPQLLERKTETRHGPGRHRSVDLKGLIMELIDETYPPLVCPTCFHTASVRSEADTHFKTEHRGNKAFSCVHIKCDQAYSSKPGLRYHLEHAHNVTVSDPEYKHHTNNTQSNNTSKPSSKLLSTFNHHHNESRESNSKRLKKQELSPQLQKKLDETYNITVCPSCKEEFKRKTHVIRHLVEVHHGEEPYKCVVSDCKRTKTYATREGLLYHLVSYHDEIQH